MFEDKNQCENFGVTLTRTVRGLISDKLYDIKNNRSVLLIKTVTKAKTLPKSVNDRGMNGYYETSKSTTIWLSNRK
jgi:hypothetical protein